MKPHERYRERPKKTGAKKRQRVKSQIRRLVAAGLDEKVLKKMNIVEIRDLIKKTARKHTPQPQQKSNSAKREARHKKKSGK